MKRQGAHNVTLLDDRSEIDGMTMREWYAGQALTTMPEYYLSRHAGEDKEDAARVARRCFQIADAMIEEAAKPARVEEAETSNAAVETAVAKANDLLAKANDALARAREAKRE